mmetsp:Transcript_11413/g.28878  ORF Transcript_11413/g.28878 Transcript_11413/m.28878 type:complete len:194 (-) Transcript_11413:997-1578(-)
MTSSTFQILLLLSSFLNVLILGIVLVFAVVIMPGFATLHNDASFLQAFQAVDGIIQRGAPVFKAVWLGSMVTVPATFAVGMAQQNPVAVNGDLEAAPLVAGMVRSSAVVRCGGWETAALVAGTTAFVLGQVVTLTLNIPLNNRVQTLDLKALSASDIATERARFEKPWCRANNIRTSLWTFSSLVFLELLRRA